MDQREFYQRYDNWCDDMFELGQEAIGIIMEILENHNGKLDYKDIYGDTDCPDWIYLDNNLQVNELMIDRREKDVRVLVEDEYGETLPRSLSCLNPDERMNIAATLIEKGL